MFNFQYVTYDVTYRCYVYVTHKSELYCLLYSLLSKNYFQIISLSFFNKCLQFINSEIVIVTLRLKHTVATYISC